MIVSTEKKRIRESKDIAKVMRAIYDSVPEEDKHKELFYVMVLNSNNIIQCIDLVAIGTVNSCTPPLRECFRLAILKDAVSIILVHNHPGGGVKPSEQDNNYTEEATSIGKLLGITVLDHIIIGENEKFYSYSDNN